MTTTETMTEGASTADSSPGESVLEELKGVRDAIAVGRVFGDPYEPAGVTIIPVAHVRGGGGGGGGSENRDKGTGGSGFGTGFRISCRPVGAYEVRDGSVEFRPAIDVSALVKGAQVLAAIAVICVTLVKRAKYRAS